MNPPQAKQLAEALGLFVQWDRDVERLSMYCKGELGGWVKYGVILETMPPTVKEF